MLNKKKNFMTAAKEVVLLIKIVTLAMMYYAIIAIIYNQNNEFEQHLNLINTVFLLYVFFRISRFIKEARKFSDEGGLQLKGIYETFLLLFFGVIVCTYNLDGIKECLLVLKNMKFEGVSLYEISSYFYKAMTIIKTAIELIIVKDVVFQINGWNLNKTVMEYWKVLLRYHKIYLLHEDINKKLPRLWLIRGGSCVDIIDGIEKCMIYKSEKEKIELKDSQVEEILRKRKSKGFDDENDLYEGESEWIFKPWKNEHFYDVRLQMIDLSYYDDEIIKKLINENRDCIQVLPSDVKSYVPSKYKEKNKQ